MIATKVSTALIAGPVKPPGIGSQVTDIFGWALWCVAVLGVFGILAVGATMMMRHRRGDEGGEAFGRLGLVMTGCILATAAGSIAGAVIGVNPIGA